MDKNTLCKENLDKLFTEILECANYAKEMQKNITRHYKKDGSVLTKADTDISNRIINTITDLFPNCNIISEENLTDFDKSAPYTFILDPIDGTDVYSQGFPSFAISLGIIDINRIPVGAMIVAPRFGIGKESLEVRLDPGKDLYIDGEKIDSFVNKDIPKQLTMSSKLQRILNFKKFDGKVRTFGSTIIQILAPVVFSSIDGCINQKAFVWDIVSSHAVLRKLGLNVVYPNKKELTYTDDLLINRNLTENIIYCGSKKCIDNMLDLLPLED